MFRFRAAPLLVLLVLVAAGCADDGEGSGSDQGALRTISAANGEVEVPEDPQRIAVLWRPTLAAVVELGFEPVATLGDPADPAADLATNLPADYDVSSLSIVGTGTGNDISVEKLAAAEPDLIIGASTPNGDFDALLPKLTDIAPTALLSWEGTGSWRTHVEDVAEILGATDEAKQVADDYQTRVEEVQAAVGDPAGTTVSLVRIQSPQELRFESPQSFPGQVIADLGFARPDPQTTPDEGKDFTSVSLEHLDQADADVIFVLPNDGDGQAQANLDEVQSNPLWATLGAVANDAVHVVEYAYWGASNYYGAHRILDDVEAAFGDA